jgi:hypothetical protein
MPAGLIKCHLRRRRRALFLAGLSLFVLFAPCTAGPLVAVARGAELRESAVPVVGFFAVLCAAGLALMAWAAARGWQIEEQPDLLALSRYGPPAEVLAAIEAELADPLRVVRMGRRRRSFRLDFGAAGGPVFGEVLLTPFWLVFLPDEDQGGLGLLRLDSIVWAYRAEATALHVLAGVAPPAAVFLADRHGVMVQVPGTDEGATRLLAEVLCRVPWVVNRFDPDTLRVWKESPGQIVAEADRRRRHIHTHLPPETTDGSL